ncbi:MAG: hypothetical protein QM817_41295 [Archangium sp.]
MKPLSALFLSLLFAACEPRDHCESIALGTPADALPLGGYSLRGQGGIFDTHFSPQHWIGPKEFRCCFGARNGARLSSCPATLDCTNFDADVKTVNEPFSGGQSLGAYFCQAAVRENKVVSVWGQYND